ncbi:MAG: bifunctional precorrin-2 dehydrogenase/sirohydrochlorin ferrochelatase [Acidobacteriaceae bacterium]
MSLFPIFVKLDGRPCLVVGAGNVALEKISSLLPAGASIRVVAPEVCEPIEQWAAQGRLKLERREFEEADLEGQSLVVTATNSKHVNTAVFLASERRNVLCNSVDDPPNCDYYFASVVQRGPLQIAISTAGESPALAQRLRREIDAQLPADMAEWVENLGELRREILVSYPAGDGRKALLHRLAQLPVCRSEQCPARQLAFPATAELEAVR